MLVWNIYPASTFVLLPHFVTNLQNPSVINVSFMLGGIGAAPKTTMTPLKETLEAVYPAAEPAVSQPEGQSSKPAGHLRSDAVSLEIPVKIHGSRVVEVARGVTPRTEPFEEQTSTMIVFPQGGVLRVSMAVSVGQMLILTNLKSRQDAICRVVKVRKQPSGSGGYVEIEFTQRQLGYWGVYFPADGPEPAKKTASPAVPQAPAIENAVPDVSSAPAPIPVSIKPPEAPAPSAEVKPPSAAPARVVPQVKPESPFISIGSQENVQLAATEVPRAKVIAPPSKFAATTFPPEASVGRPATPSRSLSMEELLADVQPGIIPPPAESSAGVSEPAKVPDVIVELPVSRSRAKYGRPAPSAAVGSELSVEGESFAVRAESGARVREAQGRAPHQNPILIAACAALLLASAAAGYLYLRHRHVATVASSSVAVQPAPQASVAPVAANTVVPKPGAQGKTALPGAHANSPSANSSNSAALSTAAPSQPNSPAKHTASGVTPNLFGTLNAHPVPSQSVPSQAPAAPSLAVPAPPAGDSGALGGSASPVSVLPASAANSQHSLAAGTAQVTQPRLISSVQPTYPAVAAQMHTQGDVIIRAQIDANGKVAGTTVVSGPTLLQQAALSALRQWKYQPSKLDGQAVPGEVVVTIRFRL